MRFFLLLAVFLLGQFPAASVCAGDADLVRGAVWAGSFYPAGPDRLVREVDRHMAAARATLPAGLPAGPPVALIFPHAGYRYSGPVAGAAAVVAAAGKYRRVVVLAPDHRVGFAGVATTAAARAYRTPLGDVPVDRASARLLSLPDVNEVPASDASEHAVEVVLPFLQRALGDFSLVPLVLGRVAPERVADLVAPLMEDGGTLLVVSSDFSHYLAYDAAVERDSRSIAAILALDRDRFSAIGNSACGRTGIEALLVLAKRAGLVPRLIARANSGDTAGGRSRVVGYAAIAFYKNKKDMETGKMAPLDQEQGRALAILARRAILEHFGRGLDPAGEETLARKLSDPALARKMGVFVTLNRRGRLRGCIGSLTGIEPIVEGVRRNAVNAAFGDPRFPPLSEEELDGLEIEVSVLSEPVPLEAAHGKDLIAKLRPGTDGVIIRDGVRSATFLPQVWKQLPDPAEFLSHLCLKAGLPADRWQRPGLEVSVYQVQYFEE